MQHHHFNVGKAKETRLNSLGRISSLRFARKMKRAGIEAGNPGSKIDFSQIG